MLSAYEDPSIVRRNIMIQFPQYNVEDKTLTGTTNVMTSWGVIYAVVHMVIKCGRNQLMTNLQTFLIFPIYTAILILRYKILRELEKVAAKMSFSTRKMHHQLLKVDTM